MQVKLTLNQILNIGLGIIILVGVIIFFVQRSTIHKERAENARLNAKLVACQNAPVQIDTVWDTIYIYSSAHVKPKPKPKPVEYGSGVQTTDSSKCSDVSSTYYSDVYTDMQKGLKIHYEIFAECNNDSAQVSYIAFPEIMVPKETITVTKTVHDTIPKEVPAKIRSKFLLYGGIAANNLETFPAIDAGIGYMHKNKWGIIGKAMYVEKKTYGGIGVFVTFGK